MGVEPSAAAKARTRFWTAESSGPALKNIRTPRHTYHCLSVEMVIRTEPMVKIVVKVAVVEVVIKMMKVVLAVKI